MDLAEKTISNKKKAHNAKRRLAQREAKKMKTACKRTGRSICGRRSESILVSLSCSAYDESFLLLVGAGKDRI